jgi:ABC-2 type transport system permease protein
VRRDDVNERSASRTVVVTTARRAVKGGSVWGVVFGVLIASSATSYVAAFPDVASRAEIAATVQGNRGFEALFGTIHGIDTVAGYTAYKSMMFVVLLGAIWGFLIATRLLRGEEDRAGGSCSLAGRTTRGQAAAQRRSVSDQSPSGSRPR